MTRRRPYLPRKERGTVADEQQNIVKRSRRAYEALKGLKLRAKRRFELFEPIRILPYRGYGDSRRVFISGRVLEEDGIVQFQRGPWLQDPPDQGTWQNFRDSIRRFRSDAIPRARIVATLEGKRVECVTDAEGFFEATLRPDEPLEPGWHDVELEILESLAGGEGNRATGQVLVPPEDAAFGVISDIDDTVVHTGATSRLKMVRIVLFNNAHTRIPFPGVGAFYRALKLGADGRGSNPIFYVSRSPWNLYDLFEAFFRVHDIPRGPLFLRDFAVVQRKSRMIGLGQDKCSRIRRLLQAYPDLPFVFIGDSGQHDPEVYAQIVEEFPARIRAIYIRDVTSHHRERQVMKMAERLREHDVPMVLARDTMEAARHAAQLGLIHPSTLEDIVERKQEDLQEAEALEGLGSSP